MLVKELRKAHLAILISRDFKNNQALFARAIGQAPALINQWTHDRRAIGEKSARAIEQKLGLNAGALDQPIPQRSGDQPDRAKVAKVDITHLQLRKMLQELGEIEGAFAKTGDYMRTELILEAKLKISRLLATLDQDTASE